MAVNVASRGAAPLVTVVMPAYNAAVTLPRSLAALRAQKMEAWECCLVDDGSTDETWALAEAIAAAEPRLRPLRLARNSGAAAARNVAIAAARGRYIAFLDADDEWLPDKLSAQLAFMEERGAAFSFTGYLRQAPTGRCQRVRVPEKVDHARLLRRNAIGCLTAMYDSAVLGRIFMPEFRLRQDYGLWLRILRQIPEGHGLDEVLAIHHRRRRSLSSSRLRASRATWGLYRQHEGLSRPEAAACLASHILGRLRS